MLCVPSSSGYSMDHFHSAFSLFIQLEICKAKKLLKNLKSTKGPYVRKPDAFCYFILFVSLKN